jgi:hydroxyacylglutathione hydrolase
VSIDVHIVETPGLGDRSYLATDGTLAVVVDPQRDIDRVLSLAAHLGVRITHVLETHVHNDYVSGGLALAEATGAQYVLAAGEDVAFDRRAVVDGDQLVSGELRVTVVATPGHTPHHVSYVVADASTGEVTGTFTGGSVLFGTVGRTDLSGSQHTHTLTRAQWRSARRLMNLLPDSASIWPTHGFGSFCSGAGGSEATKSTAGVERGANTVLMLDEASFVAGFLAGLGPYPTYYGHIAPLNRRGAPPPASGPPADADAVELRRRLAAGEWVVDLRSRVCFAAGHLAGAVNVEGIPAVATYVGWILPWGTPLSLVGADEASVSAARLALSRIGIEPVARHLVDEGRPAPGFGPSRYPVKTFADLAAARADGQPSVVLDVRGIDEWREGHLPGAVHIPWHDLSARMEEVPAVSPIWVHCATGYRAAIAASLLERADRRPVLLDDHWEQVYETGLKVERAA